MNDSFIIVDVSAFGSCIKRLFEACGSHDFVGLTSSYEYVFHVQSYFMCFNAAAVPGILSYFETHGLPANHQAAISQYELRITSYLIEKGCSSHAVVSNNDMQFPLNTTCCKWSAVLQVVGIIKRQHFFKKYAYVAMTDADITLVAEKYSYNKHFMHFLKYNGIAS
jgi:lipopolysaccharide biosynthesis protein